MTAPMDIKEAAKVLRRHNEWRRGVRGADDNHWQQSQYSPTELGHAIDAAVVALEGMDTITERARELIGLHLSEQEGLVQPTAAQFIAAVDALAPRCWPSNAWRATGAGRFLHRLTSPPRTGSTE